MAHIHVPWVLTNQIPGIAFAMIQFLIMTFRPHVGDSTHYRTG